MDRYPEAATLTNTSCNRGLGFKNSSRLCHRCAKGYKRKGTNRCDACPKNQGANWGFMFLGLILLLGVLAFLVGDAINDAGKQTLSASIQKILLNYLQVVTLFSAFPLRWPAELEFLFEAQGAISTVGEHLVNPDCVSTSASAAELYYAKQQMFAAFPLVFAFLSFLVWYLYGSWKNHSFFKKRTKETRTTPKDKFIITITTVLSQ